MQDELKTKRAKNMFEDLCDTMTQYEWKHKADEDILVVETGCVGGDVPVRLLVEFSPERERVQYLSLLPFRAYEESKRLDVAVAATAINNRIGEGAFCASLDDGSVVYILSHSFCDSCLDGKAMLKTVQEICATIDQYNDHLLLIAKDLTSLDQFLEYLNNKG